MYVRSPSQEGVLGGDEDAYILPCTYTVLPHTWLLPVSTPYLVVRTSRVLKAWYPQWSCAGVAESVRALSLAVFSPQSRGLATYGWPLR
jgi:hypothetical protein